MNSIESEAEGADAQQLRSWLCQRTDLFGDAMKQTGRSKQRSRHLRQHRDPLARVSRPPLTEVRACAWVEKLRQILPWDS